MNRIVFFCCYGESHYTIRDRARVNAILILGELNSYLMRKEFQGFYIIILFLVFWFLHVGMKVGKFVCVLFVLLLLCMEGQVYFY